MRKQQLSTALMLGGLTMLVAGCSDNHYRVTDPTSGNAYYTTKVDDVRGGAVKIKDEKTGSIVTLQSSEVKKISEDEYQAGMMAKAPAKPAPVQPAATQLPTAQALPAQP
jgi:GTPase